MTFSISFLLELDLLDLEELDLEEELTPELDLSRRRDLDLDLSLLLLLLLDFDLVLLCLSLLWNDFTLTNFLLHQNYHQGLNFTFPCSLAARGDKSMTSHTCTCPVGSGCTGDENILVLSGYGTWNFNTCTILERY